jgi:hypothetical protein
MPIVELIIRLDNRIQAHNWGSPGAESGFCQEDFQNRHTAWKHRQAMMMAQTLVSEVEEVDRKSGSSRTVLPYKR